jgi:catechol 2,3-dioxygenase-like lactoylglutathione lyase family enzyme
MKSNTPKTRSLEDVPTPVTPSKFAHFVLKTAQFPEIVRWYKTVLSARVTQESERLCFLTYDQENHRVAIVYLPGLIRREASVSGVDHVSYTYATLAELLATYRRLKAEGIVPRWSINHVVTTSLYYEDPDGNRVELQFENFPTDEKLNEYMQSEEFSRNTLGDAFDPEEMIRCYEAGVPVEELTRGQGNEFGEAQINILAQMGLVLLPA